jgi:predicted HTH domain antitoxin
MEQVQFAIPESLLLALNMSAKEVIGSMQKEYAARMFQQGKLTLGQAAQFCGMQKFDFTSVLAAMDIPVIDYDVDDFKQELQSMGLSC